MDRQTVNTPNKLFEFENKALNAWLCKCVMILNIVQQLRETPIAICLYIGQLGG